MLAKRNRYKFNTEFLQGLSVDEVAGGWRVKSQPSIRVPFRGRRFYRHGWQSWSFSGWLSAGHTFPTPPSHPMAIRMNEDLPYASWLDRVSAGVAMLEDEHGNALLLGAADPGGRVFYEENALRGAYEEGSGDWFIATGATDSLLEAYARFLQTRYGAPRHAEAPRVWCSWYSLYYFITQPVLLGVCEADYFAQMLVDAARQENPTKALDAVRFLAAKGERFDWRDGAAFLLTKDPDRRESLCRRIATAFYTKKSESQ